MSIGGNIKKWRELRNLKQSELAELVGVSDKTVSSWEINRTEPKMGMVEKISKALDCKKTDIIGIDEEVDRYKQEMIAFSKRWNIQYFEKKMLESFSLLSDENKKKSIAYTENLLSNQKLEDELNAAHQRTDIETTEEMKQHDDDIMKDPDF